MHRNELCKNICSGTITFADDVAGNGDELARIFSITRVLTLHANKRSCVFSLFALRIDRHTQASRRQIRHEKPAAGQRNDFLVSRDRRQCNERQKAIQLTVHAKHTATRRERA